MLATIWTTAAVALTALLASSAPASVEAHGELVLPKPTYPKWGGGVSATISPSVLPFSWQQDIPGAFDDEISKTGLSLKEFILTHQDMSGASDTGSSPACGYSDPNGSPQPLPEKIQFHSGFIHWGPCEAYCDDVLVTTHVKDCRASYPTGAVPYDKAKCAGAKRFTFYWLTMDGGINAPWQVYNNCVPLSGGAASDSDSTPSLTPSTPATNAPTPTTEKPAATTRSPAPITNGPAPGTSAPQPATSAPSGKCVRNRK